MVEQIPRIAAYVEFLQRNPQIKIHIAKSGVSKQALSFLGLDPERIVSGDIRASVLYAPAGRLYTHMDTKITLHIHVQSPDFKGIFAVFKTQVQS